MAASTPLNFRGSETSDQLKTASPTAAQFIAYKVRRELWVLPNLSDNTPLTLLSHGAGTASLAELNSSEICGLTLDASNESYSHLWIYPSELDVSKDIKFRILWSETGTGGAGSALFVNVYTSLTVETDAIAIGATALGTAITADTPSTTAYAMQWSPWGTIAGATITDSPGEDCMALKTYVTLTTITDATVYQQQVEYERRFVG